MSIASPKTDEERRIASAVDSGFAAGVQMCLDIIKQYQESPGADYPVAQELIRRIKAANEED